ncbi:MAG TPA: NADH-quinone oxidoreductase subunit L [Chitinophagaceae bacterium]|nr:NADH-quinone oxidoreductase subunit L [Chitinophagaceae bacterium]
MNTTNILLIPLLPLLSFVLLGLFGKSFFKTKAGLVGCSLMLVSFIIAVVTASSYFFSTGLQNGQYQQLKPFLMPWLKFANGLVIEMGLLIDPLSMIMIFVVTFISLMVHIFSLSYMKGEERFHVYYAFLGLFTFSMLGLVLSSNIFQIYIFWELVGVSSFLLIGFFYQKSSALAAAKKAFIVTRFADLGFLIGILLLSAQAGTLDFLELISKFTTPGDTLSSALGTTFLGFSLLSWGLALVFMGAAGKSAMFPLHIWLPDAMEGPTPVSALIHAATMVVAGVFLVARLYPVYAFSGAGFVHFIDDIGAFTALFAAVIACTQTDIKRVLAYSTISQIGFMMFALGQVPADLGAVHLGYTASIFHLFTHAIFKALLFLGAGAVIHYVHSNEMKDMGGLRKKMPVTHAMFLLACLAIAGVPPFAGFFSKEEILLAAWENNPTIFWMALITSGLTAFYMFRLYFSIFWNKEHDGHHHEKEGDIFLLAPLVILGIGTVVAGFVPFSHLVSSDRKPFETELHLQFSIAPVAVGLIGILLASWMYRKHSAIPENLARNMGGFYKAAKNKFYIDEVWLGFTKGVLFNLIAKPAAWVDRNIVDGMVKATGSGMEWISYRIKGLQSGKVQQYGLFFLFGIIIIVSVYLFKNVPWR